MKRTLLIIVSCIISISLSAQNYSQTVKGKIIDGDTQISIPGVNVILIDNDPVVGTITDVAGNFRLENVRVGRRNFKISYVGYEDVYLTSVVVGTGKEVVLDVKLKESVTNLEEITINGNKDKSEAVNSMATVSARQVTIESTSRIAAGIEDLARTAQSYAGISAVDDEGNEIIIRGNSPRGMLWRMEGIEIPNPNHFTNGDGGSGGGISALSSQVLANSDFYTGAFPAEYGNALSGVFDLKLRKGNFDKREYAFQVGVLGVQAAIEGPFSENSEASYLLNYRYSTLSILSKIGVNIADTDIVPVFQDLSFNISIPTKKLGKFTIFGIGGLCSAGDVAIKDSLEWKYDSDKENEDESNTLGLTGITYNYLFKNKKTYLKTVALYSYTNNDVTADTLGTDYIPSLIYRERMTYNTFSVNSFINHKFNSKNVIRAGGIYTNKAFNLLIKEYDFDEEFLETQINTSGNTNIYQAYLQWKYRLSSNVDINTGVHYTYLALNEDYAVEPRLGIKWKLNNKHTINIGAGLHSKTEPVSIYLAEIREDDNSFMFPNKNIKLTKAFHAVLGYNWKFAKDFRINTEIYYQHLYDVPVKLSDTTGTFSALNFTSGFTNQKLENKGTGRNYGAEITIEKFFSKNYYFLATASIFESKYTMADGIERNTLFNSNYIFNLVAGKEFLVGKSKQNVIGTNIRAMWRGGYKTVPVDIAASIANREDTRDYTRAFETKTPDYFRIDFGISFKRNKPKWSWRISLDIQNITNRQNVWGEYYSETDQRMKKSTMVGLIPILNYRVEF